MRNVEITEPEQIYLLTESENNVHPLQYVVGRANAVLNWSLGLKGSWYTGNWCSAISAEHFQLRPHKFSNATPPEALARSSEVCRRYRDAFDCAW